MCAARWSHAKKYDGAHGMPAVDGIEERGLAVPGYLSTQSRGPTRYQVKIVIVSRGVGLNASKEPLLESGGLGLAGQQQFVGAVHVLDPSPHMFSRGKLQGGLHQVAVEVFARR